MGLISTVLLVSLPRLRRGPLGFAMARPPSRRDAGQRDSNSEQENPVNSVNPRILEDPGPPVPVEKAGAA
jgi:hypothetical protein